MVNCLLMLFNYTSFFSGVESADMSNCLLRSYNDTPYFNIYVSQMDSAYLQNLSGTLTTEDNHPSQTGTSMTQDHKLGK